MFKIILKYTLIITVILYSCILQSYGQLPTGTIPFDCPDVPSPTFQFNQNSELINLISTDEVFSGIENLFIQTYDYNDEVFDKVSLFYNDKLMQKEWQNFVEDINLQVYILTNTDTEKRFVDGIFVIVKSRLEVYLLNIVGKIPRNDVGTVLANLNILGIWIPELKKLGQPIASNIVEPELTILESTDKLLDRKTPTMLRIIDKSHHSLSMFSGSMVETHLGNWTYNTLPIQRIKIHSHTRRLATSQKERINSIKELLFRDRNMSKGPEDFAVILERLLDSDVDAIIEKVIIDTDEQMIQLYLEDKQEDESLIELSQQFHTTDAELIHEIRLKGIQNIEPELIKATLNDCPSEIEIAVISLVDTIPVLTVTEVEIEKFGQQRIAKITVREQITPISTYTSANSRIGFNRVTGWELGVRVETGLRQQQIEDNSPFSYGWYSDKPFTKDNSKLFAQIGYGYGNDQPYYRFGGNYIWGEDDKWKFGLTGLYHHAISILNSDLYAGYADNETILFRLIGVPDHHDYFLRKGTEVSLHWYTTPSNGIELSLLWENHESLDKSTDWHFLNMRSDVKVRENLMIRPSHLRSIYLKTDINNRNNYLDWHNTFIIEHSNPSFGSDYNWTRFQTHLRYAFPFGRNQLRSRFVLSSVVGKYTEDQEGPTLLPIQRQIILGGIGTLNGYPQNTFSGDEGYLL